MNKVNCLILSFFLFTSLPGQSQFVEEIKEVIARKFEDVLDANPHESIYIQTSKDIYETGEDLWFKVYVLNSHTLSPSLLSKTLYLQLVNEKTKKPVWQEKYGIQNGFSDGRILLNENLEDGNYLIEVFTANSFYAQPFEFTAVRRVKVVNDISYLKQLKVEFEKKEYRNNDTIKLMLRPYLKNDTAEISINSCLLQTGRIQEEVATKMRLNAEKEISFEPQQLKKGSEVLIEFKYKDHSEDLTLPIPCIANPIQFNVFPEGGSLVYGIKTKVAFKAININGEPVNVEGTLFKNDSVQLIFRSSHDGMGFFELTPELNTNYYIKLNEPLSDSIYSFPSIKPEGLTLRLLSRDKSFLSFLVSGDVKYRAQTVYLMVQIRGVIYGLTEALFDKNLIMKVPLKDLPQGIAEATLFNSKGIPMAERLVYVNPEKKISIQTILSDSIVPTRGKVNLKIIARDKNNNPVKANLGLTVFDKIYDNQSDSISILTHMYLSEQLKGRIYNPGYYFNEKNKNRESALDILLLTQGWRNYIWNEANLNKLTTNKKIISDSINGTAFLASSGKKEKIPKSPVFIISFSPEKDSLKKIIKVNSDGFFSVDPSLLENWRGQYIYFKPMASTKALIRLDFINPFEGINNTLSSKTIYAPWSIKPSTVKITEHPLTRTGAIFIKDIIVKGERQGIIRGKYLGALDSIARFSGNVNTDYVCREGFLNCPNHRNEPDNREPIEGEKVKVHDQRMWIIYHYIPPKEKHSEEELLKIFNLYRIKAYYAKHEFYQPNYDKGFEFTSIPDYRNTLLWAPSIITNDKGEASVSFFCSDYNTEFVGRIEGTGGENLLGSGYFKITVRKLQINTK